MDIAAFAAMIATDWDVFLVLKGEKPLGRATDVEAKCHPCGTSLIAGLLHQHDRFMV